MLRMLKPVLLGLGLTAAAGLAAQAQSISSLPPNAVLQPQTARTYPYGSTQSFYPKPGGGEIIQQDPHYQAPADYVANKADHPYSTSIGPGPGAHSSGTDQHYQSSSWDAAPAHHPYSAGMGPKTN